MRAILRLLALALAFASPLLLAAPVLAQDDEEEEEEASTYPDDWPRVNKLAAGVNGVLTWPADPVMFSIEGDEVFADLWKPKVTGRIVGALAGLLQAPWRLATGLFDAVTSPLAPIMYMVSPVPRFTLIPYLHDDE
jgi:hypothetical protein